ncbi:PIN domain-containing protein [Planktothrix paucivesiculata]|uniref:PIN domain-containing protein n=1 Tax=Planktothrix paucivesiculata PCC 9631 TaxID=671071 RepID=A0A7Z9BGI3_9CYAN|nr:hypothetical protein [Planktothrix paucivesiculata]VXD12828.1 hypothetical protein PL9631_1060215 [Planktothrix paucivesiculata PCC 9631]
MILLDTHVWLWLLHDPSQLSESAQAIIESDLQARLIWINLRYKSEK